MGAVHCATAEPVVSCEGWCSRLGRLKKCYAALQPGQLRLYGALQNTRTSVIPRSHGLAFLNITGRIWRPPIAKFPKEQSRRGFPCDSPAMKLKPPMDIRTCWKTQLGAHSGCCVVHMKKWLVAKAWHQLPIGYIYLEKKIEAKNIYKKSFKDPCPWWHWYRDVRSYAEKQASH